MNLCIRAHDLIAKGTNQILEQLDILGLNGVQMVCYKAYDDIPHSPGAITTKRAKEIGTSFNESNKIIPLIGAYFNPVNPNQEEVEQNIHIFSDYLKICNEMNCKVVASETGSYLDKDWAYHPNNRTSKALQQVVTVFSELCKTATQFGVCVGLEASVQHVCWNIETLKNARTMIEHPTKVIFDLCNLLDRENQENYLKILDQGLNTFAGDIHVFHMKDILFSNEKFPVQVPFGTGQLNIKEILRLIKNYDKNATLVLEGTTGDDIPHAVRIIKEIWEGCI